MKVTESRFNVLLDTQLYRQVRELSPGDRLGSIYRRLANLAEYVSER